MVQRQGLHHPVAGRDQTGAAHHLELEHEVAVAEGNPLGRAGGARGVEQGGPLIGGDLRQGGLPVGE